jgi:hypothetical protein
METSHMKPFSIVLAAALLVTGGAASAQSANDARCIVLATGFANQSKDANQQKIAEDTLYFYLGRVTGQPSAAQFKTALDAQSKTITDANAATLMSSCVGAVKTKVQLLQSIATPPKAPNNPQGR